ncbi:MAG: ComE operon protein 3 [candidate division WS2 bacterium]|uniref:ComE operon protein 3 n=1 Tax=Psychracetigena formicireducens TaxID=2986056 RepID=A0A9E2BGN4_PSYF1|nr:ComE operon protein 3 [Candidatus Psychracetigena formicireducens]MBT9145246.1 ComE operon protein 3 [Candidatus Psychracetigena formicireducens]
MVPPSVYLLFSVVSGIYLAYLKSPFIFVSLMALGIFLIKPSVRTLLILFIGTLAFLRAVPFFPGETILPQKEAEYLIKITDLDKSQEGYRGMVSLFLNPSAQNPSEKGSRFQLATFISDRTIKNLGKNIVEGEYYLARGSFRPLRPQLNFYGFNEKEHNLRRGVSGYLRIRTLKEASFRAKESFPDSLINIQKNNINNLRAYLSRLLDKLPPYAASFSQGVLLGIRPTEEEGKLYRDTGTYHILIVSGMHFALLFSIFYLFRFPKIIIFIILTFYLLLVGLTPSSLRAYIMIILPLFLLPGRLKKPNNLSIPLLITAASLVLFFLPHSLFSLSFYLSFAAVLGILAFSPGVKKLPLFNKLPPFLKDSLSASISANFLVLPLILYYFLELPLYFLSANLWGTTLTTFFLPLGLLYLAVHFIPLLELVLRSLLTGFAFLIHKGLEIISELPFTTVLVPYPFQISFIISLLLFIVIYNYRYLGKIFLKIAGRKVVVNPNVSTKPYHKIFLSLIPALLSFFILLKLLTPSGFELVFLYAGQGNGALLRTPSGRVYLIDAGSKPEDGNNYLKLLSGWGKTSIDSFIVTHPHSDHYQASKPLLEKNAIKKVFASSPSLYQTEDRSFQNMLFSGKTPPRIIALDKTTLIRDGEVNIEIIPPLNPNPDDLNSYSMLIIISYRGFDFLITGDAPLSSLSSLTAKMEVLKVPHHGGKNSLNLETLKRLEPQVLVISAGIDKLLGHPLPETMEVIEEYRERNNMVKTYITSQQGAISFRVKDNKLRLQTLIRD